MQVILYDSASVHTYIAFISQPKDNTRSHPVVCREREVEAGKDKQRG